MICQRYHIEDIKVGEKTATRRDWESKQVKVGNTYRVVEDLFTPRSECDCFIRVTDVYRQALGDMTDEDAWNEGDYASVVEFRQAWESINGEGSWDPEKVVWVAEFEYVGETDPRTE